MKYWKWSELREKIENDMDLQESPEILGSGELVGYANDAIDMCEALFIGMPDYFFATTDIAIVAGTKDYELPADIYATKIRKIFIDDEYELKELRNLKLIPQLKNEVGVNSTYLYKIINNPGERPVIRLYPTPSEGGTMEIFYTRNANRLTGGEDDEIDVPEAMGLIIAYIKRRIYEKERSPLFQLYDAEVMAQKALLEDALSQRIDDENNEIAPDSSLWDDHT